MAHSRAQDRPRPIALDPERSPSSIRTDLERLSHDHARLRQVVDLCPDPFYATDADGRFVFANRAAAAAFGLTPTELVGRTVHELGLEPTEAERMHEAIRFSVASDKPIFFPAEPFTLPDGVTRHFEFRDIPYIDERTGARHVAGVGADVTDRIEHNRLEQELSIAHDIQEALLPGDQLQFHGYELAGFSEAASHAGGDHYDWLPLPDGRLLLTLADVSGHGIGPAIVTAVCRAYARAVLTNPDPLPSLVQRLNELVSADLPMGRFITFLACVLDPRAHTAEILSAGHGPFFVVRDAGESIDQHGAHGLPLGVDPDIDFNETLRIDLTPGDALVVISDGFIEAPSPEGELFGADRFVGLLQAQAAAPVDRIINHAREALSAFAGGAPNPDDMTMVVLRRERS